MIFQTYIPRSTLGHFVERMIYFRDIERTNSIDRFLPDGNCEIVIDLRGAPQFIYDNETIAEIQACHDVWISGIRTKPISIPAGNGSEMFIIAFRRGMAYPFFPAPMTEIADLVVDADLVSGKKYLLLREMIFALRDSPRKFAAAEEFLLPFVKDPETTNRCVRFAVEKLAKDPDRTSLEALSDQIGYSHKHFISLFKRQVGLTPKNFLKIMRFQKAVAEIEISGSADWASISVDCGYYDQSHFINDFKVFSGFTPQDYVQRKTDLLNYVPVA